MPWLAWQEIVGSVRVQTDVRGPAARRNPIIECLEAILRERNFNSKDGLKAAAGGGARLARILDLRFLSRPAPPSNQCIHPDARNLPSGLSALAAAGSRARRNGGAAFGHGLCLLPFCRQKLHLRRVRSDHVI